ncbi:hypothetical protein VQ045_02110 [Aurantimonas sp. E1-2-R+4]|uniref:hypothetical protein n=1 Tax=Aurantimonas sp. E1-2-R+4 TaxID=3113714 RepID=UPI002F942816
MSAATARHVGPQLARQASRALAAQREILTTSPISDAKAWALFDRLRALEAEAEFHPSGNGDGLLFKLATLSAVIEMLPVEMDPVTEYNLRRIGRLVEQLREDIERLTGASAEALGYAGHYFDAEPAADNDDVAA